MKITKIEVQKKNKNRVNLYLDENFYCGLLAETIIKHRLKEGQDISLEFVEFLKNHTENEMALNKATAFISKSQKSRKQVFDYLLKKGFEENSINFALEKLGEYNYINDELFAKSFVKFKTKSNGKRKILMELKQKGVDECLAKEKIEEYAKDCQSIVNVAQKYLRGKDLSDIKTKQKAYRFLASKGYESGEIVKTLNKFLKEGDEIESWDWYYRNWEI